MTQNLTDEIENFFKEKLERYLQDERTILSPNQYTKLVLSYSALRTTSLRYFDKQVHADVSENVSRLPFNDHVYVSVALQLIMKKIKKSHRNTTTFLGYYVSTEVVPNLAVFCDYGWREEREGYQRISVRTSEKNVD